MASLTTNITYIKGVGEKRAGLFHKLGVATVGALLRFYPRAYLDLSESITVDEAQIYDVCCIKGEIFTKIKEAKIRKGMTLYKFSVRSRVGGDILNVTLFNNKYLAEKLVQGDEYIFYGRIEGGFTQKQMASPEIEPAENAAIRPIYRCTEGLTSRTIAATVKSAFALIGEVPEPLPDDIRERNGLTDINTALKNIHFAKDVPSLDEARRRLVFDEFFILSIGLQTLKSGNQAPSGAVVTEDKTAEFWSLLPFTPTSAQVRAANDCVRDIMLSKESTPSPEGMPSLDGALPSAAGQPPLAMHRLIQGDVGSGKTAVAAAVCHTVIKSGYQCALMAPTEILAEQHYRSLCGLFKNAGIRSMLLTGSTPAGEKRRVKEALLAGEIDFIIGTHALIEDNVQWKSLGLIVTDEPHRFGVEQRAKLSGKGDNPHLIVMSATPIPRTLALIIYGDLSISVLDEKPPGRQDIDTFLVTGAYRARALNYIKKHIDEGYQGYIVCPLVEDSEDETLASATEYFGQLQAHEFKDYRVGLLHGKLKSAEKDAVMRAFSGGELDLLIATTVIEVGVDVPNAAIMVIENAERFGLSQLHQLRGRVGRSGKKSSCILISDSKNSETVERLKVMTKSNDGFFIAEEDLRLRGPGDFFGSRQHGLPQLRLAELLTDMEVLNQASAEAKALLEHDPKLEQPGNAALKWQVGNLKWGGESM